MTCCTSCRWRLKKAVNAAAWERAGGMSPMRVLLVARPGQARDRFQEELAALGAQCELAATPDELAAAARDGRYCGVLFDVPTLVREKDFDKRLLHDLASVYPSVRLKYNPATDMVHALGTDAAPVNQNGLSVFVAACREVVPRALRRGSRVTAHLPVVLHRSGPAAAGDDIRAVTFNLCPWGCFVVTADSLAEGDRIELEFPDIAGCRVPCQVSWLEPWGRRRELPGVGLAFLEMPEALAAELERLGCEPDQSPVAPTGKGP